MNFTRIIMIENYSHLQYNKSAIYCSKRAIYECHGGEWQEIEL